MLKLLHRSCCHLLPLCCHWLTLELLLLHWRLHRPLIWYLCRCLLLLCLKLRSLRGLCPDNCHLLLLLLNLALIDSNLLLILLRHNFHLVLLGNSCSLLDS